MNNKTFHYTIHGNPNDGWSLMVYQYVPDKHFPPHQTITPYTNSREDFKTLKEIHDKIKEYEAIKIYDKPTET